MHALAHLFGFELLTRIRNWKDLVFYRPTVDARYAHIDSLFGQPGENAINWRLIETHWPDLMQVALSIREGRLSSTLLPVDHAHSAPAAAGAPSKDEGPAKPPGLR